MPEESMGFIGLGIMGGPMAGNLKAAGDRGLDHSALLKVIEQGSAHQI